MKKSSSPSDPRNPWTPPEGRFKATVASVKIDEEEGRVRVIFRIPEQAETGGEYFAGKTYTPKQYDYLERELKMWLGSKELQKLFPDNYVVLEKLKQLKDRCAVIEVEHIELGHPEPFCDITSIRPCLSSDDNGGFESPRRPSGFKLSSTGRKPRWN